MNPTSQAGVARRRAWFTSTVLHRRLMLFGVTLNLAGLVALAVVVGLNQNRAPRAASVEAPDTVAEASAPLPVREAPKASVPPNKPPPTAPSPTAPNPASPNLAAQAPQAQKPAAVSSAPPPVVAKPVQPPAKPTPETPAAGADQKLPASSPPAPSPTASATPSVPTVPKLPPAPTTTVPKVTNPAPKPIPGPDPQPSPTQGVSRPSAPSPSVAPQSVTQAAPTKTQTGVPRNPDPRAAAATGFNLQNLGSTDAWSQTCGLVVDARTLEPRLKPSASPAILGPTGEPIWPSAELQRNADKLEADGMALFVTDPDEAALLLGSQRRVVRVEAIVNAADTGRADTDTVYVSSEDAGTIRSLASNCRVVFVR